MAQKPENGDSPNLFKFSLNRQKVAIKSINISQFLLTLFRYLSSIGLFIVSSILDNSISSYWSKSFHEAQFAFKLNKVNTACLRFLLSTTLRHRIREQLKQK